MVETFRGRDVSPKRLYAARVASNTRRGGACHNKPEMSVLVSATTRIDTPLGAHRAHFGFDLCFRERRQVYGGETVGGNKHLLDTTAANLCTDQAFDRCGL